MNSSNRMVRKQHCVVTGGRASDDDNFLVILFDEDSLQKLRSPAMWPFLG